MAPHADIPGWRRPGQPEACYQLGGVHLGILPLTPTPLETFKALITSACKPYQAAASPPSPDRRRNHGSCTPHPTTHQRTVEPPRRRDKGGPSATPALVHVADQRAEPIPPCLASRTELGRVVIRSSGCTADAQCAQEPARPQTAVCQHQHCPIRWDGRTPPATGATIPVDRRRLIRGQDGPGHGNDAPR